MGAREEQVQALAGRINALVEYFAASEDPEARQNARELVQRLMEMYGAGLETMLRIIQRGEGAAATTEALVDDELVSSLLVLHDLHPEDGATRIGRGLERVRALTGADVALLGLTDTAAHVRVDGGRGARAPAPADLRRLIEEIVQSAAPDVVHVEVEGLGESPPALVQLTRAPSRGDGPR